MFRRCHATPIRLIAVLGAAVFAMSSAACVSGGQDAATTSSVPSSFVATDEVADVMEADVPDGWVEFPPDPPLEYFASSDGSYGLDAPSIHVTRFAPAALRASGRDGSFGLESRLIDVLQSLVGEHDTTDVEVLPARFIDGNPAWGYTYIETGMETGRPKRWECWMVGRHDGLWNIKLRSAPGQTELPSELDGVLDTITWREP